MTNKQSHPNGCSELGNQSLLETCPVIAKLHTEIGIYYTFKIVRHGPVPRGVDWGCTETQDRRLRQLMQLCEFSDHFSLNDIGCGYGALLSYLEQHHRGTDIDYLGTELSGDMVRCANQLWSARAHTQFLVSRSIPRIADYCIASGIFNVKLDQPIDRWEYMIATTLDEMYQRSQIGFAVNFMADIAEGEVAVEGLYRTSPERWINFCSTELGAKVEMIADADLGEFTLLVQR